MAEINRTVLEKALEPHIEHIGSDSYIFVTYDIASVHKDGKWYTSFIVNTMVTVVQNVLYTLIRRTGVSFAKWLYPRVLKPYLTQFPLHIVMNTAIDLKNISDPHEEEQKHLQIVIEAQLKLLHPSLSISDADDFLKELGQQVLNNPPTRFN